jgi:predicted dehydrogenase
VAVVGTGNMGANHVRVYDELPGAELVAVVEPDDERAREIRERYDVEVVDDVASVDGATAATVAVPNQLHREVAEQCIESGLDVLVEKPLATTVEDAEAIVETADDRDAVLQVGHIERFNPAVEALGDVLENHELFALEAHRLGPFNDHLTGESVVYDLMVHDLDVVCSLVDSAIDDLNAVGTTPRSEKLDHAIATLRFEDGTVASTTSSHVTHGKVRNLRATTDEAYVELNYQEQDLTIQRRGQEGTAALEDHVGYRTETVTESPYIQRREPLQNELEHFLDCVRTGAHPRVDGRVGVNAVALASEVIDAIRGEPTKRRPNP